MELLKECNKCKTKKPYTDFGKYKSSKDGYMYQCKVCNRTRVNQYNEDVLKHTQKYKDYNDERRFTKHGITSKIFYEVLEKQGNACKICKEKDVQFVIDHDHSCCNKLQGCAKCFRGIICQSCNKGLGNFKDNIMLLEKAITYLKEN